MKVYQRKTKGLVGEQWQLQRSDFTAQTKEAYSAMNE